MSETITITIREESTGRECVGKIVCDELEETTDVTFSFNESIRSEEQSYFVWACSSVMKGLADK